MNQTSDALIIEAVLSGNKDAYGQLVDRYKNPLFNLVFRMTSSVETAQDLSQEAFIRAFTNLHRYKLENSFFTWLYTICLNLTRNHLTKKREVLMGRNENFTANDTYAMGNNPSPENLLIAQQAVRNLEKTMRLVPMDLREAVVLRYMQELPFNEVAQILGISLSAAKMRVYRGLEKLRSLMGAEKGGKDG
ncbi:MAG: sigma-70 family RNA polymerase sigma factor [Deltaproteobacteria bacterium]|nr:sigma-70 family RNA polymerase sigma factor [Deltaproteobacteria bacterium]